MSPELENGLFGLGGAVVGAVLTGVFAAYQARKAKTRKELSVRTSIASELIAIDDRLSKDVELRVAGEVVPTVYLTDVTIANSGTEVLSDVQVPLSCRGDGKLVSIRICDSSFRLDDGYGIEKTGGNSVVMRCKYLNAGDEIVIRALVSGRPKEWVVDFRQPGVELVQRNSEPGVPDVVSKAVFDAIRQNWVISRLLSLMLPVYRVYVEEENAKTREKRKSG